MNSNHSTYPFDRDDSSKKELTPLSEEQILTHLVTERIGRHLVLLEEIDSTNSYIVRENENLADGTVVVADHQTAGRGRRGRKWTSPPGKNLMFSLLLRHPALPPTMSTLMGALAVIGEANRIEKHVALKWPNDVVGTNPTEEGSERKIGGVLCESKANERGGPFLVVGIGVNVHSDPEDFPEEMRASATSLRIQAGREWDRNQLLAGILNGIESYWATVEESGTETIIAEARSVCTTLGKRVRIEIGKQTLEGEAIDLDSMGRLMIRDDRGGVSPIGLGEVTQAWRIT